MKKTTLVTPPLIVGFAGPSGSGKSTLARKVCELIETRIGEGTVARIFADWYYHDLSDKPPEERAKTNFDHVDAIAFLEMIVDLRRLKAGHTVEVPRYKFRTHTREESVVMQPRPIIFIDGILIFWPEELRELFDLRYFVDVDLDECLARRLMRDVTERGRTVESVLNQWMKTVKPGYLSFVEPTKRHANLIIPHGGENELAIRAIAAQILEEYYRRHRS